jgi:hypothetical protein
MPGGSYIDYACTATDDEPYTSIAVFRYRVHADVARSPRNRRPRRLSRQASTNSATHAPQSPGSISGDPRTGNVDRYER